MCRITVEVVPWLNKHFGATGLERLSFQEALSPGATIRSLLDSLAQKYPSFKAVAFEKGSEMLSDHIAILVNDSWQHSEEFDLPLKDGDKITLLPAFSGGRV